MGEADSSDVAEVEPQVLQISEDEYLYHRLSGALRSYSLRQAEVLRLASYVRERAAEIDDAKGRAKKLIEQRLSEVDETALGETWEVLRGLPDDLGSGDLSESDRMDAFRQAIGELAESLPAGTVSTYLENASRAMFAPPAVPMLLSSLLVTLVGEIELLVAEVARTLLERNPRALDESGRSFTWSEVAEFPDLDAFREHVIDRCIEDLLRGSLDDWLTFFQARFKMEPSQISRSFAAIEAVQRRHIIVHNGGQVSRQYLEKLKSFRLDVELDQRLNVDYDYLVRAADVLYTVGFGLVVAAAFKACRKPEWVAAFERDIGNRLFFLLQERRYEAVELICDEIRLDRMHDEGARLVVQVNGWLALKLQGKFETCRSEVEAFETGSRSNDFKLAKLALLDQLDEALDLAQRMRANGELLHEYWLTWPLLRDVREHEIARRDS